MHRKTINGSFRTIALWALLACLLASPNLLAFSVGDVVLKSGIGYPLLVSLPLRNTETLAKEEIHIRQAPIEVYEDLGVDRAALYKTLLFDIDDNRVLNVYSTTPIRESSLHFVIEVRWPQGNLYREVKLLLGKPARVD